MARITTRTARGRPAIEELGAECAIGDPNRLATLSGVLDGVAIACWLLATARGPGAELLHGARVEAFLARTVDSAVRGFIYEAPPGDAATAGGERIVGALAARNAIPLAVIRADPAGDPDAWLADARAAVATLLG